MGMTNEQIQIKKHRRQLLVNHINELNYEMYVEKEKFARLRHVNKVMHMQKILMANIALRLKRY